MYAECVACLEQALNLFMEIGRLSMSARYAKVHHQNLTCFFFLCVAKLNKKIIFKLDHMQEIAESYEQEQNLEQAIAYYDKAADLFQGEEVTTSANQCKQKIAQFSAQLEQ